MDRPMDQEIGLRQSQQSYGLFSYAVLSSLFDGTTFHKLSIQMVKSLRELLVYDFEDPSTLDTILKEEFALVPFLPAFGQLTFQFLFEPINRPFRVQIGLKNQRLVFLLFCNYRIVFGFCD